MKIIQVDEDGYFMVSGVRLVDEAYGRQLLSSLYCEDRVFYVTDNNEKILVEAFDDPLVVQHIEQVVANVAFGTIAYGLTVELPLETFRVDPWDRFHCRTKGGMPAVLSRAAQMEFFNRADSFDDNSVTFDDERFEVVALESTEKQVGDKQFWSEKYQSWQAGGNKPHWDLEAPAEPLRGVLPQLKIPLSRICVLGSGSGHDAAYFASQGHIVTGVDMSETAISMAQSKFAAKDHAKLKFVQTDAFKFAKDNAGQFDVIFEHTFFCAVDPARRIEVVDAWSRLLAPGGHVLGVFFVLDRSGGPPFGASEWDIREYLKPKFEFLYWTRWHHSVPSRAGYELVVYAKKKSL